MHDHRMNPDSEQFDLRLYDAGRGSGRGVVGRGVGGRGSGGRGSGGVSSRMFGRGQGAFDFSYHSLVDSDDHTSASVRSTSFDIEKGYGDEGGGRCLTCPSPDHWRFMLYMFYQLAITIIYTQVERHFHFDESHYLTTAEWIDQMLVFFLFLVWHLYRVADHRLHLRTWKTGLLFVTTHSTTMFVWGYVSQIGSFQTDLSRMKTWSPQMWVMGVSIFIVLGAVFGWRFREIVKDGRRIGRGAYHPVALTLFTPVFIIALSYILSSKVHIHHWWLFWWLSFFFGNSEGLCMLVATSFTMGVFSQSAATYVFGQLL